MKLKLTDDELHEEILRCYCAVLSGVYGALTRNERDLLEEGDSPHINVAARHAEAAFLLASAAQACMAENRLAFLRDDE